MECLEQHIVCSVKFCYFGCCFPYWPSLISLEAPALIRALHQQAAVLPVSTSDPPDLHLQ